MDPCDARFSYSFSFIVCFSKFLNNVKIFFNFVYLCSGHASMLHMLKETCVVDARYCRNCVISLLMKRNNVYFMINYKVL